MERHDPPPTDDESTTAASDDAAHADPPGHVTEPTAGRRRAEP